MIGIRCYDMLGLYVSLDTDSMLPGPNNCFPCLFLEFLAVHDLRLPHVYSSLIFLTTSFCGIKGPGSGYFAISHFYFGMTYATSPFTRI